MSASIYETFLIGLTQGLDILGTFLTSSPVAPLNKEFVEIEEPLWYVTFR